jgi:hypothetical protein
MKVLLLTCICLTTLLTQAQTAILAHKSHSGSAVDFFTDPSTNFGIPSRKLQQVVYLNDSTVIHVYSRYGTDFDYDTIRKHTNYSLNIDSVKQQSPHLQRVEYVNFKHSSPASKIKQSPSGRRTVEEIQPYQQVEPTQKAPAKKKKSYLLFLFGITGGGLILFRAVDGLFHRKAVS